MACEEDVGAVCTETLTSKGRGGRRRREKSWKAKELPERARGIRETKEGRVQVGGRDQRCKKWERVRPGEGQLKPPGIGGLRGQFQ